MEIPLFAPLGVSSWALINLILSILGLAFAAVTGVRAIMRKRKGDREADASDEADEAARTIEDKRNRTMDEDHQVSNKRERLICMIIAGCTAIIAVFLFILTQDLTSVMALVDLWTIVHVVLFVACVIACRFVFRIIKEIITFKTNGMGVLFTQKIKNGKKLKTPKIPFRQGYIFAGWFADMTLTSKYDFNNKVNSSFTLFAKWTKNPRTGRQQRQPKKSNQ